MNDTLGCNSLNDYNLEVNLSYSDLVEYLIQKYGAVNGDYFVNESCTTKNKKISRTKEGLQIHHIDEDKAISLSQDTYAKTHPFSYQKAERLVYCNILEHLLLHIKIVEKSREEGINRNELAGIGGAVCMLCPQINDYYNGLIPKQEWRANVMRVIEDSFDNYIMILRYFWNVIQHDQSYCFQIRKKDLSKDYSGNVVKKIFELL